MEKKLLSIREAASTLGMGRSLIYLLVKSGELKSIKIGRSRRILASEIDAFIARRLAQEYGHQDGNAHQRRKENTR